MVQKLDKFIRIVHFKGQGLPPAAEFEFSNTKYHIEKNGRTCMKTHFLVNFDSLRLRMKNMQKPENGGPQDLTQEIRAMIRLLPAHIEYHRS